VDCNTLALAVARAFVVQSIGSAHAAQFVSFKF
jgi:hypothetical protein